jgi:hypothetical protein
MSIPIARARELAESLRSSRLRNFVAQSKAKQVLRDVGEVQSNYPAFEPDLDDRITFIAYGLLAAGCSLIEQQQAAEGREELRAAADMLESAHRSNAANRSSSALHCLIAAMAFYSCGQYSRAFVAIRRVEWTTAAATVLGAFLTKNFENVIVSLNGVLLAQQPTFDESRDFDDWALTICLCRSLALTVEYAFTGDRGLLEQADSILHDAMTISEQAAHPAYWWLARLLRLMLADYGSSSLWSVLPPHFDPNSQGDVGSYIQLLAFRSPPVIELWDSQISTLKLVLNTKNRGGVVNLRTSGGKTRVAELAMLQTLVADPDSKVLYLAPFRSLAFEMERTFNATLSPLGYTVSQLYGGSRFSRIDQDIVNESRITIATPEKAKAMIRAAPDLFASVKLVVVDEGHLLGGNERNVKNEVFLEHLRLLLEVRKARMLLLSAVLPNAADLATWIGGNENALAKSDWKPSAERFGRLRWKKTGASIEWIGDERCFNPHFVDFRDVPDITPTGKVKTRQFPKNKTEAVAATAVRLSALGPVLIFAGQAQWVPSMAKAVNLAMGADSERFAWPEVEWKVFESVCNEELGADALVLTAARIGVICHSNALSPQVRIAVEKLMAARAPRVIVATTTLGQGVNIGISSVIVATTWIGQKAQITKRDFWNICGRAGRAFVDGEGKVLFAIDATRTAGQVKRDEMLAKEYFDLAGLDEVQSGLLQVVKLLHELANDAGVSFETLLEACANDSFDHCGKAKDEIARVVDWIDDHLLALHIAYHPEDGAEKIDWVDDAFRNSLAVIQERASLAAGTESPVLALLQARAKGVLVKVPANARKAVVASGLPVSVGVQAFAHLDTFREMIDRYLTAGQTLESLYVVVSEFEKWARKYAAAIMEDMPAQEVLDTIRPRWLSGVALRLIIEACGDDAGDTCADCYGYKLSWLFHSIAQKLDKILEESRVDALTTISLLLELGLPTEAASKVFLAGVRSRTAAVDLGRFVRNPKVSVSKLRKALLNKGTQEKIARSVSPTTLEWLRLLSSEHPSPAPALPPCADFTLDAPADVETLHVQTVEANTFLCSTDARYKFSTKSTEKFPFHAYANKLEYVFVRADDHWTLKTRYPSPTASADGDFIF